jgi:hypothetical protein
MGKGNFPVLVDTHKKRYTKEILNIKKYLFERIKPYF